MNGEQFIMKKIVILGLIFGLNMELFCQNDGTIDQVEIKIVKDYNVFIEEANKLHLPIQYSPQFKDKSAQKKMTYNLPDRIEQFKFEPGSIEPIAYKSKEFFYTNTNFFKLGAGSLLNPILEWSHAKLKRKTPYKIYLLHNSAWLGSDSFQKFSESKAIMDYTLKIKNWTIEPQLTLNHKLYNFYGNLTESNYKAASSRNYSNIDLTIAINNEKTAEKSISIKNKVQVNAGLDNLILPFKDKSYDEILTAASSQLTYKHSENAKINLSSGAKYYSFKNDTFTDKWLLNIMPTIEYKTKALKVIGGLDVVYGLINSNGNLNVFPKLESEIQLIPNLVNFYSIWERKIELNTHANALVINPFVDYQKALLPNTKVENRSAGIKGAIKGISYHAYFNQKILKDAILFKNDSINPRFFTSVLEKNMTQNNVSLELGYQKTGLWSAYIKADLFLYELDNLITPYNLPGQRISFGINLAATKKLNLTFNTFAIGGVKSKIGGKEVTNPIAMDINIGGEYLISKNFYIFANLNNILNAKIVPQIGYNSYGFNGQGGFRIKY
jgi:hypothetical protein